MKIVFFSPYADIDRHAIPEALIASELLKQGNDIFYVTCGGLFRSICNCMYAKGLNITEETSNEEKDKICIECKIKSKNITNIFPFKRIVLDNYLHEKDYNFAYNIVRQSKSMSPEKILFKKIKVGQYAAYEFCLNWKLNSLKFSKEERARYEKHLLNCIYSVQAAEKIFAEINPQRIILYNGNYSVNRSIIELAKKKNIKFVSIHGGNHFQYRYESLYFENDLSYQYRQNSCKAWQKFKLRKLTKENKIFVNDHINAWKKGEDLWVYSEPYEDKKENLKSKKGINYEKKVVSVLLSSFDERFAAGLSESIPTRTNKMFRDQKKWINFIFSISKKLPDIFFILRVHPREYSNKRESITSKNKKYYEALKQKCPENIWVNTPEEKISLYDIIKITDIALNQTSTTGLECLYHGIPVLGTDPNVLFAYPKEFNHYSNSKKDYIKMIQKINTPKVSKDEIEKWILFKCTDRCVYFPKIWPKENPIYLVLFNNLKFFRTQREIFRSFFHFRKILKLCNNIKSIQSLTPLIKFITK